MAVSPQPLVLVSNRQTASGHRYADRTGVSYEFPTAYRNMIRPGSPFVYYRSREGTNVTKRFQRLLAAADLPKMRFHDLRHTSASLLLALGVHPRVVMERLGHSQIALTMNTYSHVMPALDRDAADQLDRALGS